jgi:hypothetical protein
MGLWLATRAKNIDRAVGIIINLCCVHIHHFWSGGDMGRIDCFAGKRGVSVNTLKQASLN